jgi:hypothetical protein
MAESLADKWIYERKIIERFGGQQGLELVVASPPPNSLDHYGARPPGVVGQFDCRSLFLFLI